MPRTGLFEYIGEDITSGHVDEYAVPYNPGGVGFQAYDSVRVIAGGSSVKGPWQGSFGRTISMWKEGFGSGNAKGGEMDGLYVVLRQDQRDGIKADGCGILIDAGFYDNDGFVGGIEGATSKFGKASQTVINQMSYQIGCMDHNTNAEIAYYGKATVGELSCGLRFDSLGSHAFFSHFLTFNYGDYNVFNVDWQGNVKFGNPYQHSTMSIRVEQDGMMAWVNHANNARLAWLDQSGGFGVRSFLDLTPQASAPPIKQGRVWFNAHGGQLMICRDGANWSAL